MAANNKMPAYDHIVVVVEENHSFGQIVGNPQASYINSLASDGALLTNYHAVTHPSQPNYFALYAGSTFGVVDSGIYNLSSPTLATVLQAAGKTFTGYIEPLSPRKHDPWRSFPEGTTVEKTFDKFPVGNFDSLPDVAFVVPDQDDDMHDGSITTADTWLKTNIDAYAKWAVSHHSLLIVVWDEDDGSAANHIPGILYGASIHPGSYSTSYNHYDILASLAGSFGLTAPNNGATAAGLSDGIFTTSLLEFAANNDFNGDGFNDILWQNANGTPAVWLLEGTNVRSFGPPIVNPGAAWHMNAAADFNGDGKADILFQNDNGTPAVWLMNGTAVSSFGPQLSNPGPSWHEKAAADFNGDGKTDILWQNDNGAAAVWLMDGTTILSMGPALPNPGPAWHANEAADFDGDGKADILWQRDDGTPAVWLMDGTNLVTFGAPIVNPGAAWHEKAAADFNGDGKTDILFQNDNGAAAVWLMDGTTILSMGPALPNPGPAWHTKEAYDANGDGKADIFWQNDDGTPAVWLMDGTQFVSFGAPQPNPGADWHMV